jgi:hypothetical protein
MIVSKLSIDDPQQLQWLSWLYMQLFLCRRGVEKTHSMKKTDVIIENSGTYSIIRLRNQEVKNHKEVNEDGENGGVIRSVPGNLKCPFSVISTYLSHLNSKCDSLWQRPKPTAANSGEWYCNVSLGHNTIEKMLRTISTFCETQTKYTNHCLRVSSCSLLGEAGYTDLDIQSVSRHKSVSSLGIYKRVKLDKKIKMSDLYLHPSVLPAPVTMTIAVCPLEHPILILYNHQFYLHRRLHYLLLIQWHRLFHRHLQLY